MITEHSINLCGIREKCFGETYDGGCLILSEQQEGCGTEKCPFYKPSLCKSWVRIEDRQGIWLIPPEEVYGKKKRG